jgi:hypothetical protein
MSMDRPATPRSYEDPAPESTRAYSAQSAVVRTLADTIEQLAARGDAADGLREQLVEEIERLRMHQADAR